MKSKAKLTRLCSILLVLVMLVGLLPTTALAAEATATADFDADPVSALALLNAAKTGTVDSTWNDTTKTLTLNGVDFTTTASTAVKLPDGATIVLNGVNTITGGNSASEGCYGIYAEGNLTISGSGTLNVTAGNASSRSCGIYAGSNTDKALTISSGTVIATGGDVSSGPNFGIYTLGYFTISGTADVTGKGGTATGDGSFGISAEKQVNISGGTVKAIGGTGIGSDGLYSGNGDIQISGGKVEAIGGDAPKAGGSAGIFAQTSSANVTISGNADVTARGGKSASDRSYGIYSINLVTISGGKVEATADKGSYYCYGIYNKAYISGGTITAASAYGEAIPNVNLKDSGYKTISFNGNGGSGHMKAYTKDGSYTLPANGFAAPEGKQLKCWNTQLNGTGTTYMPGDPLPVTGNVTLYAQWGDAEYTVNVTNGTASNSESTPITKAAKNTEVTLTANKAPDGKVFDKWVVESGGITLANATSATTTFTMPAEAVSVKATYKAIYAVSVTYGTASSSGAQAAGTSITITANEPAEGQRFKEWTGADGLTFTDGSATTATATFTMPDRAVALIATYENIPATTYTVTVTSGTASPTGAQAAGTSVTITANDAPVGKRFKEWTGADGLTFTSGSKTSATATFTMPDRAVTLVATYEDIPVTEYNINVTNGTASVSKAAAGTTVTLTANTAPSGQVFDKWEVVSGGITLADATSATTTFTMPVEAVSVRATYKANPAATTGGGGGSSSTPTHKVESEVSKDADGSVSFSRSSAKKGDAVTITVTPDRYYKVDGVTVKDKNGKEIAVTDNGDGTFTFKMPDSKVAVEPVFSWENPFTDVDENAYYAAAVEWALKNDVTGGTTAATFSPDADCTRAQIVTFLWRAAGCPEPAGAGSFTDVSADAYYAKAVAWAVEQGITGGTGDGKFSPDAFCTRSQSMTFLYRTAGSPEVSDNASFSDVESNAYYAAAVAWAEQNDITGGIGGGLFGSANECTRAQIVAFLYRFFVK